MKDLKEFLRDFRGNRVLMTVYPHPDDETMCTGGLLTVAKSLGYQTVVVCLTKGAAGQVYIDSRNRKLIEIRVEELEHAVEVLGVDELVVGDFDDGKLRAQKKYWHKWVRAQIEKFLPGIVVTYDHSGNSGHPDHIALSVGLLEVVKGLKKKPVLLWTAVEGFVRKKMVNEQVSTFACKPEYVLDLGLNTVRKWLAARAHRSQKLGKDWPLPPFILFLIFRSEWYHQVDLDKDYQYKFVEFKI